MKGKKRKKKRTETRIKGKLFNLLVSKRKKTGTVHVRRETIPS